MQRGRVGHLRQRLDDAGARVLLHQPHQIDQRVAAHRAVGVEHDHVAVVAAPAAAEVGHVAGLALGAALAPAVEQRQAARTLRQHRAQPLEGPHLGLLQRRILGVGQHEHVEALLLAGGGERLAGGAQAGEHLGDVLVADRHHERGAHAGSDRAARSAQLGRMRIAAPQRPGAHHRGGAADADPGEQQRHQHRGRPPPGIGVVRPGVDAQHQRRRRPSRPPAPAARGGAGAPRHARRSRNVRRRSSADPARAQTAVRARSRTTARASSSRAAAGVRCGRARTARASADHSGGSAWDQVSDKVRDPARRKARSSTGCLGLTRS